MGERERELVWERTNLSCTVPQKHVAVASVAEDQPSVASPASGM